MKMVKKILLGLTATALVLGMASCKMGAGEGDTEGKKDDLTMTVDATSEGKAMENGAKYRRFWKELSSNEGCAALTTDILIDTKNSVTDNGVATTGLIFNLNKQEGDDKVEFILVGISKAGYYVERYYDIEKGKAASGDSSDSALGSFESLDGKGKANYLCPSWWNFKPDEDGIVKVTVAVTQTNKVYTVKINGKKVSDDAAMAKVVPLKTKKIDDVEYAVGGVAVYGSVQEGNKLVATFKTDKESVIGKLEAEEE